MKSLPDYLEIATKEILICPTTDHQQEIVSLSEKKKRNKQLSLLHVNFLVGISRTEAEYSNLKLGNVNGYQKYRKESESWKLWDCPRILRKKALYVNDSPKETPGPLIYLIHDLNRRTSRSTSGEQQEVGRKENKALGKKIYKSIQDTYPIWRKKTKVQYCN